MSFEILSTICTFGSAAVFGALIILSLLGIFLRNMDRSSEPMRIISRMAWVSVAIGFILAETLVITGFVTSDQPTHDEALKGLIRTNIIAAITVIIEIVLCITSYYKKKASSISSKEP